MGNAFTFNSSCWFCRTRDYDEKNAMMGRSFPRNTSSWKILLLKANALGTLSKRPWTLLDRPAPCNEASRAIPLLGKYCFWKHTLLEDAHPRADTVHQRDFSQLVPVEKRACCVVIISMRLSIRSADCYTQERPYTWAHVSLTASTAFTSQRKNGIQTIG